MNLGLLTSVLNDIKRLKSKAKKIEIAVDKLGDRVKKLGIDLPGIQAAKSVSWVVSHLDVIENWLSVEDAIDAGLITKESAVLLVQTSLGQVFKTDIIWEEKRLREQAKIQEFYRGEGIEAGSKITLTKIGPNKYGLEKAV